MDIKLINEVSWGGNLLAPVVHLALKEMKIKHNLELIETDNALEEFGISKTPAMMINGNIVLEGETYNLSMVKDIIRRFTVWKGIAF